MLNSVTIVRKSSTEDGPSGQNYTLGKLIEKTSRRTTTADIIIDVLATIEMALRLITISKVTNRTDTFTLSAIDTRGSVNKRIPETLFISRHNETSHRTGIHTS
jgi:hypothetical protein